MTGTPSIHPGMQRWTTILDGGPRRATLRILGAVHKRTVLSGCPSRAWAACATP
jgi:hypothetical protein